MLLQNTYSGLYCKPGSNSDEYEEGAIPPFIVHTQKSMKRMDASERIVDDVHMEKVGNMYASGLFYSKNNNPYGYGVRTTPNGSMQQDIF